MRIMCVAKNTGLGDTPKGTDHLIEVGANWKAQTFLFQDPVRTAQ